MPLLYSTLTAFQGRNTLADWMFYDVSALTPAEFSLLSAQTHSEGAILVVEPRGSEASVRVQKFTEFRAFRSAPGDLLRHFAIAGVGSSDVGAAALARVLANRVDAPVGAIVAGYGLSDLFTEALGGWFFFGALSRARRVLSRFSAADMQRHSGTTSHAARSESLRLGSLFSPDTSTLIRLLDERERRIDTLLGHSKGCLSVAYALRAISERIDGDAFARAKDINVITTGAVVDFPSGLSRVRQYLGTLDWFGGMNSNLGLPLTPVPNAWHHLNTTIPLHMNLQAVLDGRYDAPSEDDWSSDRKSSVERGLQDATAA
ncbi:MAG: hypothetical protein PVG09_09045 [Thiohalocapsa sp.]